MYKIISASVIKRLSDSAFIPADPANSDYQAFEKWVAEGNTPEPADVPTAEELAERARIQAIKDDVQRKALVNQLKTATNAQINAYVDNQVTDLASARAMLKRILLVLALTVGE